jgi:serpin B
VFVMSARLARSTGMFAAALLAAALALGAPSTAAASKPLSAAQAATAVNQLGLDLLRRAGSSPVDNAVLSPYSIATALAMADAGAHGATEKQIEHVLHIAGGRTAVLAAMQRLRVNLLGAVKAPSPAKAADRAQLDIANGLWVQSGFPLLPPFARSLAQTFGAAPQTTDFSSAPEPARQAINQWVASHTGGIISELLGPGTVDRFTKLVLGNAIYMKATWASTFDTNNTAPGQFTSAAGQKASVPFMSQSHLDAGYASGRGYVAVDLRYAASNLSMLIVMPAAGTLQRFQAGLSAARLARISNALAPATLDLRMPRFHVSSRVSLKGALSALGMPLAFGALADFSAISRKIALEISAVEHAADLKADEHGTVAAAATGITFMPTAAPIGNPIRLVLDHPFTVFVRDLDDGAVLFAARIGDASSAQA